MDLPTIGLQTFIDIKKYGLRGVVLQSKKNIFLDKIEESIFLTTRESLVDQGCVFFGAFANRLYLKNNSEKKLQDAIYADERAIDLACRFGYSVPNAYKSLGGALKELIEKTRKKKKRSFFEDRLEALRKSAEKARSELSQQEGSEKSISSENVYGQ